MMNERGVLAAELTMAKSVMWSILVQAATEGVSVAEIVNKLGNTLIQLGSSEDDIDRLTVQMLGGPPGHDPFQEPWGLNPAHAPSSPLSVVSSPSASQS